MLFLWSGAESAGRAERMDMLREEDTDAAFFSVSERSDIFQENQGGYLHDFILCAGAEKTFFIFECGI